MFDVTNKKSYDDVGYWYEQASMHGSPDAIKILVGNKIDLKKNRDISFEEACLLAKKCNMKYIEVSAKEGDNVNTCLLYTSPSPRDS